MMAVQLITANTLQEDKAMASHGTVSEANV